MPDTFAGSTPSSAPSRTKVFSLRAFQEAWSDHDITRDEIAKRFGMSSVHCWRISKQLRLPRRRMGPPEKPLPEAFIRSAWLAGVASHEIASRAGISPDTLFNRVATLGLPLRGSGARPKMTLEEFDQIVMRQHFASAASIEQAHLINAEMVDFIDRKPVGKRHAGRVG